MCAGVGNRTCLLLGFPIRKSSDQRSVDSSPRLIAASYVLHRLLVPRHPPCALNNLATQTPTPTHNKKGPPAPKGTTRPKLPLVDQRGYPVTYLQNIDARVHCAVLKVRRVAPHPPPPARTPSQASGGTTSMKPSRVHNPTPTRGRPVPSGPN